MFALNGDVMNTEGQVVQFKVPPLVMDPSGRDSFVWYYVRAEAVMLWKLLNAALAGSLVGFSRVDQAAEFQVGGMAGVGKSWLVWIWVNWISQHQGQAFLHISMNRHDTHVTVVQ